MWKNTWAKIFSMLCDGVHLVRPQRVDELVLVVLEHCQWVVSIMHLVREIVISGQRRQETRNRRHDKERYSGQDDGKAMGDECVIHRYISYSV
jgi:hypothetical protein